MGMHRNEPLPSGLELGGHRIIRKLASGGSSIVYLAKDESGKVVVIKEYAPSTLAERKHGELALTISVENHTAYHRGLKRFFDEGRALAQIVHPNVVSVVNFFRANQTVYLVMPYESGRSLQDHILRCREKQVRPLLSERFIRTMFGQVMNGLREVHSNKLLHLDVKPANIYLRIDGTPILLDFGAALQILKSGRQRCQTYTPGFAPPEMYEKHASLGPWTDIYSVGASMFACMAGAPPQTADQRKCNDKMDRYLGKLEGLYSPELLKVIRWSLMIDPLERPQSVFEMQKALRNSVAVASERGNMPEEVARKFRRFLSFYRCRQCAN